MQIRIAIVSVICLMISTLASAQPTSQPGVGRFPHIEIDIPQKQVRVECEALHCEAPLEFLCVTAGGSEHESVIRTRAKPSQIHAALLMLGMEPGEPLKFIPGTKKWLAPHGPPVDISFEFDKAGKHYSVPATRLMRDIKTKKPMPSMSWVFVGSRVMGEGKYAADIEGYVVSIVNFELTLIDVPALVSSANETLEWEADLDLLPPLGSPMTMILQPLGADHSPARPAEPATAPSDQLSNVTANQELIERLRQRWDQEVRPHAQEVRKAAQAQYEVISSLRREQQRLVDESDRIQRLIDELEHEYQQITTPAPEKTE
ncbi:MAG TPA: YdjY domain-containing protein [Tepidisphaeraceae bacterium]|nr:YdjY domain-containing protein [Tepidisphaeraceae bacterium]